MVASRNIERLEHSSVKLTLTVAADECRKHYEALIREYSGKVAIPGFRKGKVPAAVLERKFGEGLKVETMGRVLESAVEEAITDIPEKPLSYSQPNLEGEPDFAIDRDFTFSVTYDVYPEVSAPDWKGLDIELPEVSLGLEDEEREIEAIRKRNAIVMEKAASVPAEKGDDATVDYLELDADDLAVADSAREGFTFEIGSGANLYKFDDEIIGMKSGESKVIEKTYPADFDNTALAGKSLRIKVTLTKLKENKLPDLDDDFAQDVSEKYKTLADLKADVRTQLEKRLDLKLRELRERSLIEALMARASVDLPRSMVDAELAMRIENMMRQMGLTSVDQLDRLLAYSGKQRTDLITEWKPNAEKSLATRLVMEKLTELGGYGCSDAELDAELTRIATESNLSIEEVRAEYEKRGNLDYLRGRLREDKLIADMLAAAKVKKGKKLAFVDLESDNQ